MGLYFPIFWTARHAFFRVLQRMTQVTPWRRKAVLSEILESIIWPILFNQPRLFLFSISQFSTIPHVFHQTPCFPSASVFSGTPCVFHQWSPDPVFSTLCFPPDPVFSTSQDPRFPLTQPPENSREIQNSILYLILGTSPKPQTLCAFRNKCPCSTNHKIPGFYALILIPFHGCHSLLSSTLLLCDFH